MRTPRPHSALRPAPLAAAVALALMPAFAMAADASRPPIASQTGASVSVEQTGSGPFVVGASSALPPPPKVVGGTPGVFVTDYYLDLGNVQVGTSSKRKTSYLLSNGSGDYVIDSIGSWSCYGGYGGMMCGYGEFQCSTTCVPGQAYPPGTSCSFSATFSPTYAGSQYTYIPICDNAGGQPRYIDIYARGFVPVATIRPLEFDFGVVRVGQRSAVNYFQVSNPSDYAADVGFIQATGPFEVVSNECTAPLAPRVRCTVGIAFVPTEDGYVTGKLVVPSTAPVYYGAALEANTSKAFASYGGYGIGSAIANLAGTGQLIAALQAPEILDVGTQIIGAAPIGANVVIRNIGDIPLTFTSFSATGNFSVSSGCPATLAVGASCTLAVSFSAPALGDYSGVLAIQTNGGAKQIELVARTQPVPAPNVRVTPAGMTFGDRTLGTTSPPQAVKVDNVGTAEATLSKVEIPIDFTIASNSCGAVLSAGTGCTIEISFRPIGFGQRTGKLSFTSNSAGSPHEVTLGGNGCRVPTPQGNRSGANPCSP